MARNAYALPAPDTAGAAIDLSRRRTLASLAALGVAPLLSACGSGNSAEASVTPSPGVSAPWAEDIQTFAANIRATHPDPAGVTRSDAWRNLLAEITAGAASRSVKAGLVDCARLAALMRDEHTHVTIPAGTFAETAIRFAYASDGIWVLAAAPNLGAVLGSRLLAVDGVSVSVLSDRLRALIPAPTAASHAHIVPQVLHQTEVLWLAGIGASPTQAAYRLSDAGGAERDIVLPASGEAVLSSFFGGTAAPAAPLYLSQPDKFYFMAPLADSQSLYFRYARCASDARQPLDVFFNAVGQALAALPVPRLVVDLRDNLGGNSALLSGALAQFVATVPPGRRPTTAVLINGGVHSSATINLYDLRQQLGARTFGEAPGTPPNHAGEVRSFVLPRTGFEHTSASKMFNLDPTLGTANYSPDVPVAATMADFLRGHDPVLERAEAFLRTGR